MQFKDSALFAERSLLSRYGIAAATVALVVLVKLLSGPSIAGENMFLLFLGAVMVGASLGGLGPGVLATILAALATAYFFIPPGRSFAGLYSHIASLALFVLEGLLISALSAALRSAKRRSVARALEARDYQESMRRSEKRFQAAFAQAAVGMVQVSLDGDWLRVNDRFCEILGYTREELPGVDFRDILMPEDLEADLERGGRMLAGQTRDYCEEKRIRRKDGSELWIRVTASLMYDASNLPEYFMCVIEDVGSRRRAEEQLRLLSRAVAASSNGIVITDPGLPDNPIVYVNPAFEAITGYAAEEAIGRNCRFLQGEDRDQLALEELRAAIREGRQCRALLRNYRKDGDLVWNELNISPVHDEAGRLVNFVGVLDDVTERKRVEVALREAESKYRTMVEHIPAVTYIQEAEYCLSRAFVSPQIETMLGYSPEEYASRPGFWAEIILPEHRDRVLSEDARTDETGEPFRVEYPVLAKDGRTVWVRDEAVLARDEGGRPMFWQGFMRDITARKVGEEELERLASYPRLNPSPIIETTVDGEPTYLNPAAEAQFPELPTLGGRHPMLSDLKSVERDIWKAGGRSVVREIRAGDRFYHQSISRLPENGLLRFYTMDVTERRRVEDALRESEERFRSLVRYASDIILVLDADGTILYESPAVERVLGFRPEERVGANAFSHFHPDDVESVGARFASLLERPGARLSTEYRVCNKEGSWRRFEAIGVNLLDDPIIRGVVVNSRDITDREHVREALRQSEELYRSVVEQATENIFLIDPESKRVLRANAALHRSLGYTRGELEHMTLYDIVAHDRQSIDWNARRVLEERYRFIGERQYRRKDGSLADMEVSASAIPYEDGVALCVVAHDVTEHRRTAENLRRSLSVLLALREAGQVLGSTLESEEIVTRLLEIMRGVSHLTAAVISVPEQDGNMRIWRSVGLEGLWRRARFAPEADAARRETLTKDKQHLFRLLRPDSEGEDLIGLHLPLRIKDQVVGVLEAYGTDSLADSEMAEILDSLASQATSALENARLYEELGKREGRLQDLVGQLLRAQEEERRRVAYEVHDGLAQVAVAAHQHLQAFAQRYTPSADRGRRDLERILRLVRGTVSDARRIIANLRPTTLDDLGLAATVSLEVEHLREEGYQVDYEENLGGNRLPDTVEITVFRVTQEALNNVRKHAQTQWVRVELLHHEDEVRVEVSDGGSGFNPISTSIESGPGERVGLAGMRERVGMLGGSFEVHSRPGIGTSIVATIPLKQLPIQPSEANGGGSKELVNPRNTTPRSKDHSNE